jgi:competence protein ComEC
MGNFSKYIKFIIGLIIIVYAMLSAEFKDTAKETSSLVNELKEEIKVELNKDEIDKLEVHFIDVGQADSILITTNNEYMLIDAGDSSSKKTLIDYFNKLQISGFKHVVATHPHEDHIGSMDDVIGNYDIENFYMPDVLTTTKTFENMLDSLEAKSMTYKVPDVGEKFYLGETIIEVLFLDDDLNNLNDCSIVLRLTHGESSMIFMADASTLVEEEIMDGYDNIKSDLIKIGHHGSSYSSSLEFLEFINPKYAVISVGKNNIYKHPSNEILKRLEQNDIKVYRTDINGTIIFESDGEEIKLKEEN